MLHHFFNFHLNNTFLLSLLSCLTLHQIYSNHHTYAVLFLNNLTIGSYIEHNYHGDQTNWNLFLHTYFRHTMFLGIQGKDSLA